MINGGVGVAHYTLRSDAENSIAATAWRARIPPVRWVAYNAGGGSQVATLIETSSLFGVGLNENDHVASPH